MILEAAGLPEVDMFFAKMAKRPTIPSWIGFFIFLAQSLFLVQSALSAVTLTWTTPTTNTDGTPLTDLAGYKVYYGTATGNYSAVLNVGNTTVAALTLPQCGVTTYFAATAYDLGGIESSYSNEVAKSDPCNPPSCAYTYSGWGECQSNGTQTRSLISALPIGCTGTPLPLTQSCTYVPQSYMMTVQQPSGGAVAGSGINCGSGSSLCSAYYSKGTVVTLSATPAAGWSFAGWSGACTGTGACSMTMNANASVSASFKASIYTITASAGYGGSISPSGTSNIYNGGAVTFTITPAKTYTISNVKVDGISQGAVSSYTFSNVTANHKISATFAKKRR